jgi:hypothetical protein
VYNTGHTGSDLYSSVRHFRSTSIMISITMGHVGTL